MVFRWLIVYYLALRITTDSKSVNVITAFAGMTGIGVISRFREEKGSFIIDPGLKWLFKRLPRSPFLINPFQSFKTFIGERTLDLSRNRLF